MLRIKEKRERSLGVKLFLKGERCSGPKCVMIRRPYRPGMHGKRFKRTVSEYSQQLLEKQKIKATYGLTEAHLEKMVKSAIERGTGNIGETIIANLERRLSNFVFKTGLSSSRVVARQLISHGHIFVNGKKMTISSYLVKVGDIISINPLSKGILIFNDLPITMKKHNSPHWLEIDRDKFEGRLKSLPTTEEILFDINLVVDYYSK